MNPIIKKLNERGRADHRASIRNLGEAVVALKEIHKLMRHTRAELLGEMSAEEYAEAFVDTKAFDEYVQDSYWQDNFSTDRCLEMMKEFAAGETVALTGIDEFEYDKFFYDTYECMEKGLS